MVLKYHLIQMVSATSLLLASIHLASAMEEPRDLQLQAAWWAIQDPEFTYYSGEFIFRWRVSDYIQDRLADIRIYDGWDCKEGSNDITDTVSDYAGGNLWLQHMGLQPDANTPYNSEEDTSGDGYRDFRLFLDVQPSVSEAPFFQYDSVDNQFTAIMNFCIRFQLFNDDVDDPNTIEVNFQETLIEFTVDLTDGFEIGNFNANPRNKLERTAFFECEIIGYECDLNNEPLEDPGYLRNQGAETRVCVTLSEESKNEGLILDRVHWFYFIREDPRGDIRQNAIIWDSVEAPNGLTEYDCMRGVDICPFNVIMRADFYQWSGVGVVQGIGEGLCQFGGGFWLVEDVERLVGEFMGWIHHDPARGLIKGFRASGFPVGTTVVYTDTEGNSISNVVEDTDTFEVSVSIDEDEDQIRQLLDTLALTAPLHSDGNFELTLRITTMGGVDHVYKANVKVYAVADPPQVTASISLQMEEDASISLQIDPGRSADEDNSEYLSVRIDIPSDNFGAIGSIVEVSSNQDVRLREVNPGRFEVTTTTTGDNPQDREAILDEYLRDSLAFRPRDHWSGQRLGAEAIKVIAVSTEQSINEIATANSIIHGTIGDMDCKTEMAVVYIDITVEPVNDLPYLENDSTTVQENRLNSDVDEELVIQIGQRMNLGIDDQDGSQTLDATISGFPLNLIDLSLRTELPGVIVTIDQANGIVSAIGENVGDVLAVFSSMEITLAHDDDRNFLLEIFGTSTDSNELITVSEDFYLTHQVIVQAVVDTPTLDVGSNLKTRVAEDNTSLVAYPVTIRLNDVDGTERYQGDTVQLTFWTATDIATGGDPTVEFPVVNGVQVTKTPGKITLTGDIPNVEAAMESMMISPGPHNGEDIHVEVTVTAIEINPSETGEGEVAKEVTTVLEGFAIPIEPVIQGTPEVVMPSIRASGPEDTIIPVGIFEVRINGNADPDGSEIYYLEIDMSTYPEKAHFLVDGVKQTGSQIDNWLRLPGSISDQVSNISIEPPPNFSGTMELAVRGIIIDRSTTGSVNATTEPQIVAVDVFPVADDIIRPRGVTYGREDISPHRFGTRIINTGMKPRDDGTGPGNNADTETITEIQVIVPTDTSLMTYMIDYEANGSAVVSRDEATRTYTISHPKITLAANLVNLSIDDRKDAQRDIQLTLKTFTVDIGPEHNSEDGILEVKATTLDVNIGQFDLKQVSFNHRILIQAIADAASVFVHSSPEEIAEDSGSISLHINVTHSDDQDDSETLSVRITVPKDPVEPVGSITGTLPQNVNLEDEGAGLFLITATGANPALRQNALNSFLAEGDIAFTPRSNWAGTTSLKIDVISTEDASSNQLAPGKYGGDDRTSKTETVTQYINIVVTAVADAPEVAVEANAAGSEDTKIAVPIRVTVSDSDGSETYEMEIMDNLPSGTKVFGASDGEISAANGVYTILPADLESLKILPPQDWSSALPSQGVIVLQTKTIVTDQIPGYTPTTAEKLLNVDVNVLGVADKPTSRSIEVTATEDEDYEIGPAIGSLDDVLIDTDGSETLYMVLAGLPVGAVAKTDGGNTGLSYLGSGEWRVETDVISNLKVSARENYAGDNPYPDLRLRAVVQEIEGNTANSDDWPIDILVWPIPDGLEWKMVDEVKEKQNEIDGRGVLLSKAGNYTYKDDDGSEEVVEVYFDLSDLIENAEIGKCLDNLLDTNNADLVALIGGDYILGDFTFEEDSGKITVQALNLPGLRLSAELFLDSNVNFNVSVSALVRETVTLKDQTVTRELIEEAVFEAKLEGTADVPTVFVDPSIQGHSKIPIDFGGDSSDTDVALGREMSEVVYYIFELVDGGDDLPGFAIVNAGNRPVGISGGGMTWIIQAADIEATAGGLFIVTRRRYISGGTRGLQDAETEENDGDNATDATTFEVDDLPPPTPAVFKINAVAVENDGDFATNATTFEVNYWVGSDEGEPEPESPMVPEVTIGANDGTEDKKLALNITAKPAEDDPTIPTVSVVFHDMPEGASVSGDGVIYNIVTGKYVAAADVVNEGDIMFQPPGDFSGTLDVIVEVIAVSAYHLTASTGRIPLPLTFDPVADKLVIDMTNTDGVENEEIPLPITIELGDKDGSEIIGDFVYVRVCDYATLNNNYPIVSGTEAELDVNTDATGYYKVPRSDIGVLSMQPDLYWHGDCQVTVIAVAIEQNDDADGDHELATEKAFTVEIEAVATPPAITGPDIVRGLEDTFIPIIGLSAELVDTNPLNGYEVLSTVISGIPDDSLFNHGANTGTGSWSIPTDKLNVLEIKAPLNYAGTFTLTFKAISLELTGGEEATSSLSFPVVIDPVADDFLILVQNQEIAQGVTVPMETNVRDMDTRGTEPGELAGEVLSLTFTDVPTGVSFSATGGGLIQNTTEGQWTFTGTENQANSMQIAVAGDAAVGVYTVLVSGYTTDGESVLASPLSDQFVITVSIPVRRDLQNQSLGIRSLQTDENALGVRHCSSEVTVVKDNPEFPLPGDMFFLDSQDNGSVDVRVKHTFANNVQWIGVLYAEAPVGLTKCPTEIYTFDQQISIQGNCKDFLFRVFIYLSVQGVSNSNADASIDLPLLCQNTLPDGAAADGTVYVYEVDLPCSTCSGSSIGRALTTSDAKTFEGSHVVDGVNSNKWINTHPSKNPQGRRMQDVNDLNEGVGAAGQFELDVLIVGEEGVKGSGAPGSTVFQHFITTFVGVAIAILTL